MHNYMLQVGILPFLILVLKSDNELTEAFMIDAEELFLYPQEKYEQESLHCQ